MRRLLYILLMFCLPLQGFAMQWGQAIQAEEITLAHEMLHDEHVSHHHEADGTLHFDSSDESIQHVQDHSCSAQPVGLFLPALAPAPLQLVERITVGDAVFYADAMLELPHRPPAFALG